MSRHGGTKDEVEEKRSTRAGQTTRAGQGHNAPLERVTVNLTARASHALDRASKLTGETKTDTINRALQIYVFLQEITEKGGAIYVRESPEGDPQLIKMF